jgi:hypothetical protein
MSRLTAESTLAAMLVVVAVVVPGARAADDLLERADIAALMPPAFRARIALRTPAAPQGFPIEIWRSGDARLLVRFLEPSERGKYLIKRDRDFWLVTRGAKRPVRVSPSHRLYGGPTIEQILGTRLVANYQVLSVTDADDQDGSLAQFDLQATSPGATYARIQYVVRRSTARPVRARYSFASGRAAASAEFVQWSEGPVLYPRRVVLRDLIRNGAVTEVAITTLEVRAVPDGLFDLADASARQMLESRPESQ